MPLPDPQGIRTILLDIEGTTTPATFVYDILIPYAAKNLDVFVRHNFNNKEIRPYLNELQERRLSDGEAELPPWRDESEHARTSSLVAYAQWLIQRDSKENALKAIQGKIWEGGYARGELRGQVYPDVPPALRRWREQRRRVYIYSSGSELAQKLLFRSTAYGDLTPLLEGFFDTRVGPKSDVHSYTRIAAQILCSSLEVLFVSDSSKELEAAQSAGMSIALAIRSVDGRAGLFSIPTIHTFDEIFPE